MAREGHSGRAHQAISVFLRLGAFCCAVIVLGVLSRFCYLIGTANVHADSRIIYTMVTAGIGILYSILFCVPFNALFVSFPMDFILFIMWLVAFCLLETRSGTCSSAWYYDYWGYYWGSFWYIGPAGTVTVGDVGCSQWRTALAFSFMASFAHLLSGILGIYVYLTYVRGSKQRNESAREYKEVTENRSTPRPNDGFNGTADAENGRARSGDA